MLGRPKTPPPADLPDHPTPSTAGPTSGKGHATPSRKEAEAANKRPLVAADRKQAGKAGRAAARQQRDTEYQAMMRGDDLHMPAQHRGPVRRYVRDWVDSRWSLAEFFLPVAIVLVLLMTVMSSVLRSNPNASTITLGTIALPYLLLIVAVIEVFVGWRRLKRALTAKFGASVTLRGTASYYVVRQFQFRRLRMPKPQVKRGELPS